MIIDTHAHYDDDAFAHDLRDVMEACRKAGVSHIINAATDLASFEKTFALTEQYDMIYTAIGIHPEHACELMADFKYTGRCGEISEADASFQMAKRLITDYTESEKTVAIGEIGLDYHYETPAPDATEEEKSLAASWDHGNDPVNWPPRTVQKKVFYVQLELAQKTGLPVVVHSRDAADDTLRILKEMRAGDYGCDMHCFGYTKESAREYLNIGCFLGIGGVSTFKNGRKLKEVISYAPLDRLLLETDAPYLAPEPYRGKRNTSAYLTYVVNAIAEIKSIPVERVMEQTTQNARHLFTL